MPRWNFWLNQAQLTNDRDRDTYSHGVFAAPGQSAQQSEFDRRKASVISTRPSTGSEDDP
jgi:hypothetical protein